jgi:hypothetical protein
MCQKHFSLFYHGLLILNCCCHPIIFSLGDFISTLYYHKDLSWWWVHLLLIQTVRFNSIQRLVRFGWERGEANGFHMILIHSAYRKISCFFFYHLPVHTTALRSPAQPPKLQRHRSSPPYFLARRQVCAARVFTHAGAARSGTTRVEWLRCRRLGPNGNCPRRRWWQSHTQGLRGRTAPHGDPGTGCTAVRTAAKAKPPLNLAASSEFGRHLRFPLQSRSNTSISSLYRRTTTLEGFHQAMEQR